MSIAEKTKRYIVGRPAVKECLRRGIINYTALAREISKLHGFKETAPVVAAARRYASRLKGFNLNDKKIERALRNTKILFNSGVCILVLELPLDEKKMEALLSDIRKKGEVFNLVQGEKRGIVIIPSGLKSLVKKMLGKAVIKEFDNLIQITLSQSLQVMTTQGVVGRLYGLFSQEGISPVESLLCGGEHLLYIEEKDLVKVMDLIQNGYLSKLNKA